MHETKVVWLACCCAVVTIAACSDSDTKKEATASENEEGVTCNAGQACQAVQVCHAGAISCDSGAPVCIETPVSDDTACGDFMVCSAGACVCDPGAACHNTPCHTATVSCATSAPVCLDDGGLEPDNTTCGQYSVCQTGDCVCNAGGACGVTACTRGEISCVGGTATCAQSALADGTSCDDASRCIAGSCTPCADIAGLWHFTQRLAGGDCTSHFSDHVTYSIAQEGCEILVSHGTNVYQGEVLGDGVAWNATVAREAGYLTITDMALTVNAARTAMTGSASWAWTDGGTSCAGTLTLDGGPGAVNLRETGQTLCYDDADAETDCAGTGQDGETLKGMSWPSPRFVTIPAESGVLVDELTGLRWIANPASGPCNAALTKTWQGALDQATCANSASFLGRNTWRVPNVNELASLMNFGVTNGASWLNGQGFESILTGRYWTSTTFLSEPSVGPVAWCVNLVDRGVLACGKGETRYVWLVSDGGARGVALPKTGQTTCYAADSTNTVDCTGTGQDAELQKGIARPDPRFTNVDGSTPVTGALIYDQLTGLTWLSGSEEVVGCGILTGAMLWPNAMTLAACLRDVRAEGYDDWRLANIEELRSLVDYGQTSLTTWLRTQGFLYRSAYSPWSSDSVPGGPSQAWLIQATSGSVVAGWDKVINTSGGAMFVRGGR